MLFFHLSEAICREYHRNSRLFARIGISLGIAYIDGFLNPIALHDDADILAF